MEKLAIVFLLIFSPQVLSKDLVFVETGQAPLIYKMPGLARTLAVWDAASKALIRSGGSLKSVQEVSNESLKTSNVTFRASRIVTSIDVISCKVRTKNLLCKVKVTTNEFIKDYEDKIMQIPDLFECSELLESVEGICYSLHSEKHYQKASYDILVRNYIVKIVNSCAGKSVVGYQKNYSIIGFGRTVEKAEQSAIKQLYHRFYKDQFDWNLKYEQNRLKNKLYLNSKVGLSKKLLIELRLMGAEIYNIDQGICILMPSIFEQNTWIKSKEKFGLN